MDSDQEEKIMAQNLLSAAAKHDLPAVRNLLKKTSANVQDEGTGYTPLHAAAAGAFRDIKSTADESTAVETVQLLLENGAIWNDLDTDNETPGDIAYRNGSKTVYQLIVDAGIRAELLLSKLDEVASDDEDEREAEVQVEKPVEALKDDAGESQEPPEDYIDHWDSNKDFLRSSLKFTDTQLLDSSSNAVMMDWETEIMTKHADRLLPKKGLRAMNIGHGMGIVDTAIQTHEPLEHHIVEAHPAVLAQLKKNGWLEKPGVHVHEGRWQDVLPKLVEQGVELDAIYYDTFAEDYKDLRELFQEHVIGLLAQDGRFGFYHGLGADRMVSYDVYTSVSTRSNMTCKRC